MIYFSVGRRRRGGQGEARSHFSEKKNELAKWCEELKRRGGNKWNKNREIMYWKRRRE